MLLTGVAVSPSAQNEIRICSILCLQQFTMLLSRRFASRSIAKVAQSQNVVIDESSPQTPEPPPMKGNVGLALQSSRSHSGGWCLWIQWIPFARIPTRLRNLVRIGILLCCLIRIYYYVELQIKDPYLEAIFYMPSRYLYVRFFDQRPQVGGTSTPFLRPFVLTGNNTFVINLAKDHIRFHAFLTRNPNLPHQRFEAREWILHSKKESYVRAIHGKQDSYNGTLTMNVRNFDDVEYQKQAQYAERYGFLKQATKRGAVGDAGCTYSHLRLLREVLLGWDTADDNHDGDNTLTAMTSDAQMDHDRSLEKRDYLLVLEDDAIVVPPKSSSWVDNQSDSRTMVVYAPYDADVVFLQEQETATKLVSVPVLHSMSSGAVESVDEVVRVIQGYGAFGYIITRRGVVKLLQYYVRNTSHQTPIDVAMLSLGQLRVYLPLLPEIVTQPSPGAASFSHSANHQQGLMEGNERSFLVYQTFTGPIVQHHYGLSTRKVKNFG